MIMPFSKRTQSIIVILRKGETFKNHYRLHTVILIFFAKTVSFKISDAQSETLEIERDFLLTREDCGAQ